MKKDMTKSCMFLFTCKTSTHRIVHTSKALFCVCLCMCGQQRTKIPQMEAPSLMMSRLAHAELYTSFNTHVRFFGVFLPSSLHVWSAKDPNTPNGSSITNNAITQGDIGSLESPFYICGRCTLSCYACYIHWHCTHCTCIQPYTCFPMHQFSMRCMSIL